MVFTVYKELLTAHELEARARVLDAAPTPGYMTAHELGTRARVLDAVPTPASMTAHEIGDSAMMQFRPELTCPPKSWGVRCSSHPSLHVSLRARVLAPIPAYMSYLMRKRLGSSELVRPHLNTHIHGLRKFNLGQY